MDYVVDVETECAIARAKAARAFWYHEHYAAEYSAYGWAFSYAQYNDAVDTLDAMFEC